MLREYFFTQHGLDEWTLSQNRRLPAGDLTECRLIQHVTVPFQPTDHAPVGQFAQRLVGMDDRQAKRVGNVLLATGAGLVFLTGHKDLSSGVPGLGEWPVVIKPFTSVELMDGVYRALSVVGKV